MTVVRAAVVQAASVPFDRQRCLEKVRTLTADAARQDAQLVLFPEAFVSAYPWGADFGATIGTRTTAGREDFRRYFDSAVEIPGPAVEALAAAARENDVYLVVGVIERDGGTLYCSVLFFAPDGRYLGKHRKLMPTAAERVVWGCGDGSTLPVLDTPLGKLGAVICWENYMPLLRTAMYAQGIQLYCAPTADSRETWAASMQHVALEGRCFVLSACQYIRRGDFPADFHSSLGDAPDALLSRGGSCIVSPLGKLLAGPNYEGETILTADLDLAEITRGKYDFDVVGHYARSDVFQLHVHRAPQTGVTFVDSPLPRDDES